jgi:hypothetical protein
MGAPKESVPGEIWLPGLSANGLIPDVVGYPLIRFPWDPWLLLPYGRASCRAARNAGAR